MKRLLFVLSGLGLLTILALSPVVLAADVLNPACDINRNSAVCQGNTTQDPDGNSIYGPDGILTRAASLVGILVGIASVIMIVIGGFKYVTSSGDPSNLKSAKDTIMFAVVGILVAVAAQSLVVYILRRI